MAVVGSGVPRIECSRKDDSNTMTKDYILLIKFTYIHILNPSESSNKFHFSFETLERFTCNLNVSCQEP